MEEIYGKFFDAMNQIRKIRIGDLFPEMTKADGMTLLAINHYNRGRQSDVLTVSELAEKIHTKPSAVSRTLKNLEEQGLIERTVNQADRRNTYVKVSAKGKKICEQMEQEMNDFSKAVLSRMKEEDLRRLIDYLKELHQVAVEEIELRKNRRESSYEQNI